MTEQSPPGWLKFAPVLLLCLVGAVVWAGAGLVSGGLGALPSIPDFAPDIEKLKREIMAEAERVLTGEQSAQESAKSPKRASRQIPPPGKVFLEIGSSKLDFSLRTQMSRDMSATLSLDETEKGPTPISLLLSFRKKGDTTGRGTFVSGSITLKKPVDAAGASGLEFYAKSRGAQSIGVAVMTRSGSSFMRWDWPDVPVNEEWGRIVVWFDESNLWLFNKADKTYIKLKAGKMPEKIENIRIYLKGGQLNKSSGSVWVDSFGLF
ncbi:MAG: hypothetical protein HY751_12880 [Nitrospinae bacterium]|nr:hypothetical protein [Nitrospinota bacterium]